MNRFVIVILAAFALAPLPLQAQQEAAARIEAAKQRLAAAGIPSSLVENRVAEGRAKNVPAATIAAAVERRAQSLIQARQAMSPAVRRLSDADLVAGAEAVEAGIRGEALRAVIEGARSEDRPVAIAVLTHLHRDHGVPVDEALSQVRSAVRAGPQALKELPVQAAAARARGGPPQGVGGGRSGAPGQMKKGGGRPEALPTPGNKPGAGKPDSPGKGNPGGKPGGTPGGRPGGGPGNGQGQGNGPGGAG